jgi:SAM-dependent methyltransferase
MSKAAFANPAATWDERYARPDYIFGTQPNAYLQRHATAFAPGGRVLCVADGEGRNSVWLARQGHAVDAFDISRVGLAKARKLARSQGVRVQYRLGGCDDWTWPRERYDGIAAIFVQFADPAMRARLFANMAQALRVGGVLVLQGYTPRQLEYKTGGPPLVSHLYTPALLRAAFAGFELLELEEYEADLSEGHHHCGRSALIGLVARKLRPCS